MSESKRGPGIVVKIVAGVVTALILAAGGLAVYLLLWTPGPDTAVVERPAAPDTGNETQAEGKGVEAEPGEKPAPAPEAPPTDEKTGVQPKVGDTVKAEKPYHELDYADPKQRQSARGRVEKDEQARKQETMEFLGRHDRKRKAADERQRAIDKWLEKQ